MARRRAKDATGSASSVFMWIISGVWVRHCTFAYSPETCPDNECEANKHYNRTLDRLSRQMTTMQEQIALLSSAVHTLTNTGAIPRPE